MRTHVDLRLLQEVREFSLRYSCEDCGYFVPGTLSCALEYPNQEHVRRQLEAGDLLVFCKEFELTG